MEELQKAVEFAFRAFHEEVGAEAKLEDGDVIVAAFKNATLIISFKDGNLKEEFIGGRPYEIDMELAVYKEEMSNGR